VRARVAEILAAEPAFMLDAETARTVDHLASAGRRG
jgi:hypothetical protein